MNAEQFGTALVATARKFLFVRESAGPNSDGGGFIDQSLAALGLAPGASWCAAAICAWVRQTVSETGAKISFRRSARGLGLLELNPSLVIPTEQIQPGDILIEDHGKGLSHVGIVTETIRVGGVIGDVSTIAGNTSADGHSRNGDRVAEHPIEWPDLRLAAILRIVPV